MIHLPGTATYTTQNQRSTTAWLTMADTWKSNHAARRFSTEDLPVFRLATISKATFCSSLRLCTPARSTALIWTPCAISWTQVSNRVGLKFFFNFVQHSK
jgi:hypothetical protein